MGIAWFRHLLGTLVLAVIAGTFCHADIEINARHDTVVLEDGTEIQCYILMMSPSGIVIVETDPMNPEKRTQRTIGRSAIKNIVIGERSLRTEELLTDTEYARKVILGSGTRKDDQADKADDKKTDGKKKGVAASKKSKSKKKDADEPEARTAITTGAEDKGVAKVEGAANGATPPAPGTTVPGVAVVVPAVIPTKDVLDVYLSRYPDLQTPALDIIGAARVQEWVDAARSGNQGAKQPFDAQLNAYLGNMTEAPKSEVQIKMAPPPRLGRYAQPEPPK